MRKILFSTLLLFVCLPGIHTGSLAQQFEWVTTAGPSGSSPSSEFGYFAVEDSAGNVYTAGLFSGTVDFDPGPGTTNLQANGSMDVFIQKTSPRGDFLWAFGLGGPRTESVNGLKLDPSGNLLVYGEFMDSVDCDPGVGANVLSAAPNARFLAKYRPDGSHVWAQALEGQTYPYAKNLEVTSSGAIYLTGRFLGPGITDFDPGPGVDTLRAQGGNNVFIQKLDTGGNHLWVKAFDNSSGTGLGAGNAMGLATDQSESVFITGNFDNTIDFDPGPGTHSLTAGASGSGYVAKLDSSGNFSWAHVIGDNVRWVKVATDALGNCFVTGNFRGNIDFDPGPDTLYKNSFGTLHGFVSRFNPNGTWVWSESFGHTTPGAQTKPDGICTDHAGHIYITGSFTFETDLDPGLGTQNRTSNGLHDLFIQKLDTSGKYVAGHSLGGGSQDGGRGVTIGKDNSIIITGDYMGQVDFDPGPGSTMRTSGSPRSFFTLKLSQDSCAGMGIFIGNVQPVACGSPGLVNALAFGGNAPYSYLWKETNDTTPGFSPSTKGFYTLLATDARGCTDSTRVLVQGPGTTGVDWQVTHTFTRFRPGFSAISWIDVANLGCTSASTELCFVFDSKLTFQTASVAPSRQSGDSLFWTLQNINYASGRTLIRVEFQLGTQANIGDPIAMRSKVGVSPTETDTANNRFQTIGITVNGYDPNDILVDPAGFCENGIINPEATLRYRIRFQNTGNADAINVRVEDVLDRNLDLSTFKLLSTSHQPMNLLIRDGRKLEFNFPNINLPDSVSNEPESHGYILFEIKPKPGLSDGTVIRNQAAIYFDFNEPIVTNIVSNTLYGGVITDEVLVNGLQLEARQSDATYQWIDCNTNQDIPGATGRTFFASQSGRYAVRVTLFGCSFTSSCYTVTNVGIESATFAQQVRMAPNPTTGEVSLEFPGKLNTATLSVYDNTGRELYRAPYRNTSRIAHHLSGPAGLYLLRLDSERGTAWFKLIKK